MKQSIVGILAHVDAGKTTLSESMLYQSGSIRKLGRVDHQDAFLDFDKQERNRGITIFSKQAILNYKDSEITLMDTPGHIDFSSEMERTLQVLDYAILLINGLDGIQAHTETIWQLLKHYQIPTFIFVNKMDIAHYTQTELMQELEKRLDFRCVDFTLETTKLIEKISLCDDSLLDYYLSHNTIELSLIKEAIAQRKIFPCYFGSALKMKNVEMFLDGLYTYTKQKQYSAEFGAKVYKINRDEQGNQLTHVKITGGSLKVKACLLDNEKVDQIRKYSGSKYQTLNEVHAGSVCALKGLHHVFAGEGLGIERNAQQPVLSSYMNYRVLLESSCDIHKTYELLKQLSQEDPQLHISYQQASEEINIQLMGEVQIEVLKHIIKERFNLDVEFDQGSVLYKESILHAVEGVGHYEPLRHYAEVHLLLEPIEKGSGIQFVSSCSEDILSRNWQRQVLTHLEEKEHIGVLTGSPITDIKITLLAGKAHLKHTEGGDFRQATYRAIRQGLKETQSILLEPYYQFRLEVPNTCLSKAIYDMERMHAQFSLKDSVNDTTLIIGSAPVAKMQNYQSEVIAYTKGKGKFFCILQGYEPCNDAEAIIASIQYDSESDLENPTGSVFCANGTAYYVKWDDVKAHMHIKSCWQESKESSSMLAHNPLKIDDDELERVMNRTYGPDKTKLRKPHRRMEEQLNKITYVDRLPNCLLVDGYNMIHSWDELKALASEHLDAARERLIDILSSYQGYKKCLLILVFDAYKVLDNGGSTYFNGSIHIVYTKKAQTADTYIEKTTHELSSQYNVTVATSDGMEQLIVSAQGARRMSSRELEKDVTFLHQNRMQEYESVNRKGYAKPLANIRKFNEEES